MTGGADQRIRWGILGTGEIASKFATDLARVSDAETCAVGSRSREAADAFAERFGIPVRYANYRALVEDPAVDVVYVALPHPWHHEWALAALESGKAVLCEKPFTVTASEARELVAAARRQHRFLMEAMWTRFLPNMVWVRGILAAGALGVIRTVHAELGQRMRHDPAGRMFARELGGGVLLDLGVYPVSFASRRAGHSAGGDRDSDSDRDGCRRAVLGDPALRERSAGRPARHPRGGYAELGGRRGERGPARAVGSPLRPLLGAPSSRREPAR